LRRKAERESLLEFTLFLEGNKALYDLVRFDRKSCFAEPNDALDPHDSTWGKILLALGIRYHAGDGTGITFLFSTKRPESVAMVLLLARMPFPKEE
jgi:hypothetical protein